MAYRKLIERPRIKILYVLRAITSNLFKVTPARHWLFSFEFEGLGALGLGFYFRTPLILDNGDAHVQVLRSRADYTLRDLRVKTSHNFAEDTETCALHLHFFNRV